MVLKMGYSKYHNVKAMTSDGIEHDSQAEARRWIQLKLLERAGEIKDLQRQVKYVLIPSQRDGTKLIEKECAYIADFVYTDVKTGEKVCEDVKGYKKSSAYSLFVVKRKLMLYVHKIKVKEVK